MTINNKKLFAWHQALAVVISRDYSSDAIADLIRGLERLVNGCSSQVIIFRNNQPPKLTHHRLIASENPRIEVDDYINGAYLLDPYYRAAVDERMEGVFVLGNVISEGFRESEYYRLHFVLPGLGDEVSYLFQLGDRSVASISICRLSSDPGFSRADIELLESTFPLVNLVIQRWLERDSETMPQTLEWHLDNALARFGSSLLTPKELKVLQLILRGHSLKAIADRLDNSQETIRHHRKNIYAKLDVGSQAELFYLFIASLREAPQNASNDPLAGYIELRHKPG